MNSKTRIAISCDHAGFELKQNILNHFKDLYDFKDFGCFSDNSVDYPDFVHPLAMSVANAQYEFGIVICGSGNGVCMTANKHQNIRAALCWTAELGELSRLHNDANVICLPSRFITEKVAFEIVNLFLTTAFEGGRHKNRVKKISLM